MREQITNFGPCSNRIHWFLLQKRLWCALQWNRFALIYEILQPGYRDLEGLTGWVLWFQNVQGGERHSVETCSSFQWIIFSQPFPSPSTRYCPWRLQLPARSGQEPAGDLKDGTKDNQWQTQRRQPSSEFSKRRSLIFWLPTPTQGNQNYISD